MSPKAKANEVRDDEEQASAYDELMSSLPHAERVALAFACSSVGDLQPLLEARTVGARQLALYALASELTGWLVRLGRYAGGTEWYDRFKLEVEAGLSEFVSSDEEDCDEDDEEEAESSLKVKCTSPGDQADAIERELMKNRRFLPPSSQAGGSSRRPGSHDPMFA